MANTFFSYLQNLWPLSIFTKSDDLTVSTKLIKNLSIPDQTKQFIFAIREPDSRSVVYILAVENLSKQSAIDSVHLINEIQPKAVIAQVATSAIPDIQSEEKCLIDSQSNTVPTSPLGVLKKCFTDKINKTQYEKIAGCQVLQEIFGIGFYGHFLAAKRAAEEVNSVFLLLESPYDDKNSCNNPSEDESSAGHGQNPSLNLQASCLVPGGVTSTVNSSLRKFCLTDSVQSQIVKSFIPALNASLAQFVSNSEVKPEDCKLINTYEPPPFAQSVYPLLSDLYAIFSDIPSIGKALVSSQKMLECIHEGKPVYSQILSDVYVFRIAIEGLRVALNSAARSPVGKMESSSSGKLEFSDLPPDEKCHVLFAHSLKTQAKKFGSVVAIVDAGCLNGIRRHWNTPVPADVADLAEKCSTHLYSDHDEIYSDDDYIMENTDNKRNLLSDKPMVAVGAGATAILGASSLSKAYHASTFFKIYKVPWVLKYSLVKLQRQAGFILGKTLIPSNLSSLKLTASAEKIRAVTHSVIASAERTSLLAMRTAFYEIMQKRQAPHVRLRVTPWVTFGFSMAACGGLLLHGDGIECAAESVPSVPMIASLGRGLEGLRNTSLEVRQTSGANIQEALQSLMVNLKKRMRGQ